MASVEELQKQVTSLEHQVTELTERLNRQAADNAELTALLLAAEEQASGTSTASKQGLLRRIKRKLKSSNDSTGNDLPEQDIELLRQSDWFDSEWYLASYPDVKQSGMDPALHYLLHGGTEGRDPSAKFNSRWYLQQHAHVVGENQNPLVHFLRQGKAQGLAFQPSDKNP